MINDERRKQLINSVGVLKKHLGELWTGDTNHPLLTYLLYPNLINGSFLPIYANALSTLEKTTGFNKIVERIRNVEEYYGAMAELEVGSRLANNGYELTIGPMCEEKRPDFLCKKGGLEFFVEVKTFQIAEFTKKAEETLQRMIKACGPITLWGRVFRNVSDTTLSNIEYILKEKATCIYREKTAKEFSYSNIVKLYLASAQDPDYAVKLDKWISEQQKCDILPKGMGLVCARVNECERIKRKIDCITKEKQIPDNRMGILVFTGIARWEITGDDIEDFIEFIKNKGNAITNILAIVIISGKEQVISRNEPMVCIDEKDYVLVEHHPGEYLQEKIIIIKNMHCNSGDQKFLSVKDFLPIGPGLGEGVNYFLD